MRLLGLAIIAAIGFALASWAAETPRTAETPSTPRDVRVAIIDTHVHPWRSLRRGGSASPSGLLRLMDQFSIERMVLLPPPSRALMRETSASTASIPA